MLRIYIVKNLSSLTQIMLLSESFLIGHVNNWRYKKEARSITKVRLSTKKISWEEKSDLKGVITTGHIHSNQEHPSDYSINRRNTWDTLASSKKKKLVLGGGSSIVSAPRDAHGSELQTGYGENNFASEEEIAEGFYTWPLNLKKSSLKKKERREQSAKIT